MSFARARHFSDRIVKCGMSQTIAPSNGDNRLTVSSTFDSRAIKCGERIMCFFLEFSACNANAPWVEQKVKWNCTKTFGRERER